MDLKTWINFGIDQKYVSPVVCATHDGLPSNPEEDAEWEAGHDPCVPALRLLLEDTV